MTNYKNSESNNNIFKRKNNSKLLNDLQRNMANMEKSKKNIPSKTVTKYSKS